LLHLEGLSVDLSKVISLFDDIQIVHQEQKLSVLYIIFEWDDRDAIRKLRAEGVNSIVNQNHILHFSVPEDAEVFDVNIISSLNAVVSV
jgi:hypothetical protein